MQKKKNINKKSKYYRQKQVRMQKICIIGLVLLLAVLILLIQSCASGSKKASSSNVKTSSDSTSSKTEMSDGSSALTADSSSNPEGDTSDSQSETDTSTSKASHDTPVSLTVSVVGDCTLGTDENFDYSTSLNAYFENYGKEYFFQNVKSIFEADDLTIANNE